MLQLKRHCARLGILLGAMALVSVLLASPAFASTAAPTVTAGATTSSQSDNSRNIATNLQDISTRSNISTYTMLGVLAVVIILAVVCSATLVQQRSTQNGKQG